jgi:hypothetical protein
LAYFEVAPFLAVKLFVRLAKVGSRYNRLRTQICCVLDMTHRGDLVFNRLDYSLEVISKIWIVRSGEAQGRRGAQFTRSK